jgi:hypothetical protein
MRVSMPPQSGTYTCPLTTAGLADTSPPTLATHLTPSFGAVAGVIPPLPRVTRVLQTLPPYIGQPTPSSEQSSGATDGASFPASSGPLNGTDVELLVQPNENASSDGATSHAASRRPIPGMDSNADITLSRICYASVETSKCRQMNTARPNRRDNSSQQP